MNCGKMYSHHLFPYGGLGAQNKDFVSSLHTDLSRGLVSSVAQATVQLLY